MFRQKQVGHHVEMKPVTQGLAHHQDEEYHLPEEFASILDDVIALVPVKKHAFRRGQHFKSQVMKPFAACLNRNFAGIPWS